MGPGGGIVGVGTEQVGVVFFDGSRLRQVERLALGHALDDVHQDHVTKFFFSQPLRRGGADVARTNDRYLLVHNCLLA